jgi:hypothetical protein
MFCGTIQDAVPSLLENSERRACFLVLRVEMLSRRSASSGETRHGRKPVKEFLQCLVGFRGGQFSRRLGTGAACTIAGLQVEHGLRDRLRNGIGKAFEIDYLRYAPISSCDMRISQGSRIQDFALTRGRPVHGIRHVLITLETGRGRNNDVHRTREARERCVKLRPALVWIGDL